MAKKRTKRFEDGGDVGVQDYASLGKRMPAMPKKEDKPFSNWKAADYVAPTATQEASEPTSFKQAFAEARKAGDKNFTYEGKKYTTELKTKAPAVKDEDNSTGEARTEKIGKEYLELKSQKAKLAAPQVTHAPASKPAKTSKEEITEIVKRTPLQNPSGGLNFMNALRRNQEVGGATMKESARQSRVDRLRRNVGKNQETYGMKKGGKVSSASSRGDGIAQRGKTKGRIC